MGQDAFDAEMTPTGPGPMSGMAVAGLTSSVILCCPLTVLLGLIFSVIGLLQTGGGRRRGRGLAIAGLLVALVIGVPLNIVGGISLAKYVGQQFALVGILSAMDSGNLEAQVGKLYELSSESFQGSVSARQLVDWFQAKSKALGGLQSVDMTRPPQPVGGESGNAISFPLKFPEKDVSLEAAIQLDWRQGMLITDFVLDGESALQTLGGSRQDPPSP